MNRRENSMEPHTGYLGTSRVVLNHFDVSTQADIQHVALSYESEDEIMGRLHKDRRGTAHYSKQDIREQYCISNRGLGALENDKQSLFGCLSSHHSSPCSNRPSFLTACVRQKVPSDENLCDLYKRHPSEYAPYPRRNRNPWGPIMPEMYFYDEDLKSSYFRRKVTIDPSRYTWMPSDDESIGLEKPRSIMEHSFHPQQITPPSSIIPGKKHVSFARSHTLASFDDAISSLSSSTSQLNRVTRSQERLLDVRKAELQPITKQPESENIVIMDKIKRAPMKTQATQTEIGLGRKPLPPSHINLSPRTIHRVKMVSQGAQTNGFILNGRKLVKSFSEAGNKFGLPTRNGDFHQFETILDHEPLQRTQSDEPPRSPFILSTPAEFALPELPHQQLPQSDTSSLSKSDHESDSAESKKEIFIDFKPQVPQTSRKVSKRCLTKTMSDGEILMEQRKTQKIDDSVVPEKAIVSMSHENIASEEDQRSFTPYFQKLPIRNEGIFKPLEENVYSSFDGGPYGQDSVDEEFHENIIYNRIYLNRTDSQENGPLGLESFSPHEMPVVPSVCLQSDERLSPFASNDSLTTDTRDQSDGIWNESQVTVLQVDSGTDNGTALSSSEMTSVTSPGSANLLTPSSRRKHLLMLQHQQRSSMDTEALDEEIVDESDTYPKIIVEKPTKKQLESPLPSARQYLSTQNAIPPMWRKTMQESPIESPLPAVVPDLLLARTDSCKTNTDVSESTTTDDYITANSGTDSSRKSGSVKGMEIYTKLQTHINEGSSFESTKGVDQLGDDMVVPTFSPPASVSDEIRPSPTSRSLCNTPVPLIRTGRSTPSDDTSSSCGSYSVGSTPDLLERSTVPLECSEKRSSATEEDRNIYYSASAYYESTMEENITWKSSKHETKLQKRRKEFSLDLSTNQPVHFENYSVSSNGKYKSFKRESKVSPQGEMNKLLVEKPKRSKMRMRSPMQIQKKIIQTKKLLYREGSPFQEERENKGTSDESSCDMAIKQINNQTSPRKAKKNKENIRRKSLPRSPVNQRPTKRNESEEKPSSLPGSLSRRKSSKQSNKITLFENTENKQHYSPIGSPPESKMQSLKKSPDTTKLKALSAESLRSVSPGSDSVFYSDPSSHTADHQVHCLHCGKEVDIVTTDDPDKSISSNENHQDIVQPPAGFEDSPRSKSGGRLYKKLDRRIRSEERTQMEQRKHRYKPDIRAKSEERGAKTYKNKLRPMAKSTNSSQEQLKATDSSPSVLPGAPEAEDDDNGIYDAPYNDGFWIYIDEREEVVPFKLSIETETVRRGSISSTESEQEFRKRYQAITHRMVHRKSCLEMYKRQNSKSFDGRSSDALTDYVDIRQKLEEILKLMLVIWCQENKALNLVSTSQTECDKTVIVHRESGEFGFRIHGSKPVVVSAIEPGTPAETSGLEVGDIVLSVNGVSVLDKSHSEVVKIAHAGSDTLKLEVARTCYALNLQKENYNTSRALYSGYLWKLGGYASGTTTNKWIRRWFSLKQNNCLYYYKTDSDKQPVGVVMLFDQQIQKLEDEAGSKPNRFVIQRPDGVPLHLAADNSTAQERWMEVISRAIADSQKIDDYLNEARKNLTIPPSAICQPDCFGYLIKLGTQWKSWNRRYCVLKDACIYFYQDANAKSAFGVACLHGYRVQQSVSGSKKHAFEVIPPDPNKKYYYFHTESEADRKRWLAALEYSIDRWLKIQ